MVRKLRHSSVSTRDLLKNKKHQFSQEHALRLYESNSIYTFIPKNACSTIRLSLAIANGTVSDASDVNWIHENNLTFQADLAALSRADYTFVVLRCPYARLVSVFLDKIVGYDYPATKLYNLLHRRSLGGVFGIGGVLGEKSEVVRKIYGKSKINDKKVKHFVGSLSFYDFVKSLEAEPIMSGDQHWRPQVDFLVYEDYDDWFCVKNFSKAAETLKRKIGLEIVDARQLTLHGTSHLKKVQDDEFPTMPSSTIRKMKRRGEVPSAASLYNAELIDMVNKLYSEDIALYKAQFGSDNLMFA